MSSILGFLFFGILFVLAWDANEFFLNSKANGIANVDETKYLLFKLTIVISLP